MSIAIFKFFYKFLSFFKTLQKKRKTAVYTAVLLLCRHRLIFPGRFQPSIVSTDELNYRVRDGNGWTLIAKDTDLRLRYCAFVSFSLAIIHAQDGFVNRFLQSFFINFQFFYPYAGKLAVKGRGGSVNSPLAEGDLRRQRRRPELRSGTEPPYPPFAVTAKKQSSVNPTDI